MDVSPSSLKEGLALKNWLYSKAAEGVRRNFRNLNSSVHLDVSRHVRLTMANAYLGDKLERKSRRQYAKIRLSVTSAGRDICDQEEPWRTGLSLLWPLPF